MASTGDVADDEEAENALAEAEHALAEAEHNGWRFRALGHWVGSSATG